MRRGPYRVFYIVAIVILLYLGFWRNQHASGAKKRENGRGGPLKGKDFAFATVLCDSDLADAVFALIGSLDARLVFPFVVLGAGGAPGISEALRTISRLPGVSTKELWPSDFMLSSALENDATCRLLQLALWNQTKYEELLYLPPNSLVLDTASIIDLVEKLEPERPPLSAMMKKAFLLKPDSRSFMERLQSRSFRSATTQPQNSVGEASQDGMIVFGDRSSPWSFYRTMTPSWREEFEPNSWWFWRRVMQSSRAKAGLADGDETTRWSFLEPQCQDAIKNFGTASKKERADVFSVVMPTHHRDLRYVFTLVKHYAVFSLVDKVYVLFSDNTTASVAETMFGDLPRLDLKAKIRLVYLSRDSLSNRWLPLSKTACVLTVDDDMLLSHELLELGFKSWQSDPDRLVGFYPRAAKVVNDEWLYQMGSLSQGYSIVLSKALFFDVNYAFLYSCILPDKVKALVDSIMNCEDIAFNFLASGTSGRPPLLVLAAEGQMEDYGDAESGISTKPYHMQKRGACLGLLSSLFGNVLQNTKDKVGKETEIRVAESRAWSQLMSSKLLVEND